MDQASSSTARVLRMKEQLLVADLKGSVIHLQPDGQGLARGLRVLGQGAFRLGKTHPDRATPSTYTWS